MAEPLFRRLALIGIGLIGSSVARIARERGDLAGEVVVNARTAEDARPGARTGLRRPRARRTPARAVEGADCVMLCAPVGAFADIAAAIAPHLAPGAILTDVGSTKQSVIRDVGPAGAGRRAFRAGASGGGHRVFRAGFRLHHAVRGPLGAADAAARDRRGGGGEGRGTVAALRLHGASAWSPDITTACWRSSRICRI